MSNVGKAEFARTRKSERSTQTILDGKTLVVKEGDEIKVIFYKLNEQDKEPVSGDIFVNEVLVGWLEIGDLRELLTEFFDDANSFEA